jgi:hypothetical protein
MKITSRGPLQLFRIEEIRGAEGEALEAEYQELIQAPTRSTVGGKCPRFRLPVSPSADISSESRGSISSESEEEAAEANMAKKTKRNANQRSKTILFSVFTLPP